MENPFIWWNNVIYGDDNSEETPEIIPPEEMSFHCEYLSPIFHTHVPTNIPQDEYWNSIRNILFILTEDETIPNPNSDFPNFVVYLFKYKHLIKITDVNTAILYAEKFCPKGENTFFENEFLIAVSDPFLIVSSMYQMNKNKFEPWMRSIRQFGTMQRFFDLFITYLQPANRSIENEYEEFRAILADLMSSILSDCLDSVSNDGDTIIHPQNIYPRIEFISSSLFVRLLNLCVYSKTDMSVSFVRFTIRFLNSMMRFLPQEHKYSRIIALMNACPSGKLTHPLVMEYALKQAELKNIPFSLVAQQLIRNVNTLYDYILLEKLITTVFDAKSMIIKFLSRTLTQDKIHMRTSSKILLHYFHYYNDLTDETIKEKDKILIQWFIDYIRKLFIFIKLSARRGKYMRRIHIICSIISSKEFINLPEIGKTINGYASACRIHLHQGENRNNLEFLEDYFLINESTTTRFYKEFTKEFERTIKNKPKLKTYPFKFDSFQLIEYNQKKSKTQNTSQALQEFKQNKEATAHELMQQFGLSIKTAKYLYKDESANTIDQQNIIFTLEDFIDKKKADIEKIQRRKSHSKSPKPDMSVFIYEGKFDLTGLRFCITENKADIYNFQIKALTDYVDIAHDLISIIRSRNCILADTKQLNRDFNKGCGDDPKYKQLLRYKYLLRKAAVIFSRKYIAPNYESQLKSCFSQTWKFDNNLQYAPPYQKIEYYLIEFIRNSPFAGMLDATSSIIEDGTIDGCVSTIWEFNNSILDILQAKLNENAMVLYNYLLREVFDTAYVLTPKPCLNRYQKSSLRFIKKAQIYSQNKIEILNLRNEVIGKNRQQMSIYCFFHSHAKFLSLEILEFYTNPLELMYSIYNICEQLSTLSLTNQLTDEETEKMLLGVLVCYPPINTIAIVKFLNKWGGIMSSILLTKAKNMFIQAVSSIIDLKTETPDDNNYNLED